MIRFLSILLWNAERPLYFDIFLFRQDFTRLSGCFYGTQIYTDEHRYFSFSLTETQSYQSKALKECKV